MGSGMARRYIDAPDWEGALRLILAKLPQDTVTYEYLSQKHDNNLISVGSELGELVFEWAWADGNPIFLKNLMAMKVNRYS